jgi:assimilatory nitrate reductase electron transfer subunit
VVSYSDPYRGTYAKLLVRDDRLAGALLLGDNPTVGTLIQLFDRGTRLPADRRSLLLGRPAGGPTEAAATPGHLPDQAVVCQCNAVTKAALVRGWRAGAQSTVELCATTRAGTGCGSCRDTIEGLAAWLRHDTAEPVDQPDRAGPSPEGT